jgi:hypothetical protein
MAAHANSHARPLHIKKIEWIKGHELGRGTMTVNEILNWKMRRMFPDPKMREKISSELDRINLGHCQLNEDRVKLAVLKLSGPNLDEIKKVIEGANEDPEDTVICAESPKEMALGMEVKLDIAKREEIQEQERWEYIAWLIGKNS